MSPHPRTARLSQRRRRAIVLTLGKRHNQALVALARRRCDTLYAMLRDGTLYAPKAAVV
jgi:hypothetical protein